MANEETAIIAGLGVIAFILSYYSFELRESEEEFWRKVSIGTFFMSMIFLNLIIYAVMLISKNGAAYLEDSILVYGMMIMNWLTIIVILGFIIWIIFVSIQALFALLAGKNSDDEVGGQ